MASTKVLLILAMLIAVAWTMDAANPAIVDSQDIGMAQSTILETISPDLEVAEHKKKKYRGSSGGGGGSSEERR
ncbi:hypothetical protein GHT06_022083 [Daphnia sinensis]|uniref:Uncharacterized protein n=1 Tax=Daphnia sinensis TaxID=1820382 RepID=A0AAD5PM76_9CRUS|nr:hypothetical protein GHT06_022083 [Daphnia sinensis]